MVPIPVHDRRILHPTLDFEGHPLGHRVHEEVAAGRDALGGNAVQDHHIVSLGVLLDEFYPSPDQLHLRVGGQRLLQEGVTLADQENAERVRTRDHGQRLIVRREVVVHVDGRLEDAALLAGKREDERPLELGGERDPLRLDGPILEGELEIEGHGGVAVVRHGKKGLIVGGPEEGLARLEGRDADVLALLAKLMPVQRGPGQVGQAGRVKGPIREHLHRGQPPAHLEIRLGQAEGLGEAAGDIQGPEGGDAARQSLAVVGEGDHDAGLGPRGDQYGLLAEREPRDRRRQGLFGSGKARAADLLGLHARRDVEDEHGPLVPRDLHRADRSSQGQGKKQDDQGLKQQEEARFQPAEGRGGLLISETVRPEKRAAHHCLSAADLEQVENDDRRDPQQKEECRRIQEAHRKNPPRRRCRRIRSWNGTAVLVRK